MPAIVIIALSDPVAIVHIPIPLTHVYTTKIYWTLDQAALESAEFFNVTANRVEMAIFGSLELITHEWSSLSDPDVLISSPWRVFEISSGDEGEVGNYDSPHLRHVSAPLARAGISILYQSSYFTDFLLVKESDFAKVARIFASQGWHFDPSIIAAPRRRSVLTPLTPTFPSTSFSPARSSPPPPTSPEITVLPSPLACVGFSKSAEARFSERVRKFLVWPERCSTSSTWHDTEDGESEVEVMSELTGRARGKARPFVSFTRNEDGASLVTEVRVLRGMFPPGEEEGMELQSGGELGWESTDDSTCQSDGELELELDLKQHGDGGRRRGIWTNGQTHTPPPESSAHSYLPDRKAHSLPSTPGPTPRESALDLDDPFVVAQREKRVEDTDGVADGKSERDPDFGVDEIPIRWSGREVRHPEEKGKKRCLQLDLRGVGHGVEDASVDGEGAYHLDKSGLVNRFSDLLTSSSRPIRMLYSSTFHTANILVEARDVKKAKWLLERRRRSAEWS